jgi:transposase
MDVHKDSITVAVLPATAKTVTRIDRLAYDLPQLKRYLERGARDGEIRACSEASGAGYVLHRTLTEWGYACEVIAPSLVPKRPGVQRKHDKHDASEPARLYRSGDLTAMRIPSEAEERMRFREYHALLQSAPPSARASATPRAARSPNRAHRVIAV